MDTLSVFLTAIGLFVLFVLFTAYFLKSYIVMNSVGNEDKDNSLMKEEDLSVHSEMECNK